MTPCEPDRYYYIYNKKNGKVWAVSMFKHMRDEEFDKLKVITHMVKEGESLVRRRLRKRTWLAKGSRIVADRDLLLAPFPTRP